MEILKNVCLVLTIIGFAFFALAVRQDMAKGENHPAMTIGLCICMAALMTVRW